ncbi:glycerophosphodiester phosphodiesterase family protein [Egicoccus halophilus]|uniref:Glycerophosphoryl diester phosphodiesterase n=1 Tax=Egicoccus halophilus TaxID=1670830 RepID=A0A8J3A7N1_9ACTN|nr:glycerophosphodiester phosphodiesterase family protein [Egicoccus halophilus]GGI05667.1 glycerophosphoryl diester phosphodiesterase [Egicoccus halophilus]
MEPSAPDWLRQVPLAHRGLHGPQVPENSLAAFRAAAAADYGVELDVMLAGDGTPVVVHDAVLTRLTGDGRRVGELDLATLRTLRLRDGDGAVTDETVPTLPEALAALDGHPAMVEVKSVRLRAGRLERAVAEVLDAHDGPACVASFNPATVGFFTRRRPALTRVLTATAAEDQRLPAVVRRRLAQLRDAATVRPHAISYDLAGLPNAATDAWRAAGGTLVTWTVADADDLARARALADNVIFEHVRP